jgi:NADH-quinone oxidoreductase subunit N
MTTLRILAPIAALCGGAVVLLMLDAFAAHANDRYRRAALRVTLVSLLAALALLIFPMGDVVSFGRGLIVWDGISYFTALLALFSLLFVVLISERSRALSVLRTGTYYALLLLAGAGLMLVGSADDLLLVLLAIELFALPSFVLAAYESRRQDAAESALKFFLMGAATTAMFAYGASLLYGMTGTTSLSQIRESAELLAKTPTGVFVAVIFILSSLGFKMALVPFHSWMPDVLQDAPSPVASFLAVSTKLAAAMAAFRLLILSLGDAAPVLAVLAVLSGATLLVASVVGLRQTRLRRLLAYSSIAHMGFLLVGFLGYNYDQGASIFLYAWIYLFSTLGAFAIVALVENAESSDALDAYQGLGERSPWLAALFSIFILSLAGVPPLAGFVGKFYVLASAFQSGWWISAGIAVLATVISIGYYFKILHTMYFMPAQKTTPLTISTSERITLAAASFFVFVVGLLPEFFATTAHTLVQLGRP